MTTVHHPPLEDPNRSMQVSQYDRVSSMLLALIFFVGFFVLLMFAIWLTSILMFTHEPVRVTLIQPRGRGDHAKGYARDIEEPGLEEIEDMTEPRIEETFEAVTDAVSNTKASLTSLKTGATSSSHGRGLGDSRAAGPGGEGNADVIDPSERWRIMLTARNERGFGRLLDALQIHLALFGGGDRKVYYAHDFTKGIKKYERIGGKGERRLRFAPMGQDAQRYTIYWLRQAGYDIGRRYATHFYPDATVQKLLAVESAAARPRQIDEIRRTEFGVRFRGSQPTFYVIRQEFRTVARR